MPPDQLLAALLDVVQGTHPHPERIPFQATPLSGGHLFLWDCREDADEGIAAAIAGDFGEVIASTTTPLLGLLLKVDGGESGAARFLGAYSIATGPGGKKDQPF